MGLSVLKFFSLVWVVVLSFSGCSTKDYELLQSKYVASDLSGEKVDILFENKVAIHDRLAVSIHNLDDTGSDPLSDMVSSSSGKQNSSLPAGEQNGLLVNSQGKIMLPLVGSVKVSGLTISQVSEKLTKLYKKYIKNPYVTVDILNQKIFVLGEVKKPGVVPVQNETITIFEVLARSGDLTDYANRRNIKIIRNIDGKYRMTSLDLTDYMALNSPDIILKRNDVVYVAPRSMKAVNVGVKEITPILGIISSTISTYASLKYIVKD